MLNDMQSGVELCTSESLLSGSFFLFFWWGGLFFAFCSQAMFMIPFQIAPSVTGFYLAIKEKSFHKFSKLVI